MGLLYSGDSRSYVNSVSLYLSCLYSRSAGSGDTEVYTFHICSYKFLFAPLMLFSFVYNARGKISRSTGGPSGGCIR